MYARLQTFQPPADKLDELTLTVREQATPLPPGSTGYYFLVDRDNGKALLLSLWENEDELRRLEVTNASTREQVTASTGIEPPTAEIFEVVLQAP